MRRNRRFKQAQTSTVDTDAACPVCSAQGDDPCQDKNGKRMGRPHKARHAGD